MAGGVRGWSKDSHLDRMLDSGQFQWCRELTMHSEEPGSGERFADLFRSQGDYQTLRKLGLTDDDLGITDLLRHAADDVGGSPVTMLWSYRVRLGVR